MTLPSTGEEFPIGLSRDDNPWLSNLGTEFSCPSETFTDSLNLPMQDVSDPSFFNSPMQMSACLASTFPHDFQKIQVTQALNSFNVFSPLSAVTNDVSVFNKKAQPAPNTSRSSLRSYPPCITKRIDGSGRVVKVGTYPLNLGVSIHKKKARDRKAQLLKAFAPLEKAKKALHPYSTSSESFRLESESLFHKLEKLIDEAIDRDDISDIYSTSGSSNLYVDSAYGSLSGTSSSDFGSFAIDQPKHDVGNQTNENLSSTDVLKDDLYIDGETPRPERPSGPLYQCTYEVAGERCTYCTNRESDWLRHEESEKHWPQKRYMCLHCAEPEFDNDLNPSCIHCSAGFSTREEVLSHSLTCVQARKKGETFAGARTDHFRTHLIQAHQLSGLDETSASWKYNLETKWPRYCGFCRYYFKDWRDRSGHVANHFRGGADISMWDPLLHNPRRQSGDESGLLRRKDDDDDDDDDGNDWHQQSKGKHVATPNNHSISSSGSNSSPLPSDDFWITGDIGPYYSYVAAADYLRKHLDAAVMNPYYNEPEASLSRYPSSKYYIDQHAIDVSVPKQTFYPTPSSLGWTLNMEYWRNYEFIVPKGKEPYFKLRPGNQVGEKTPHEFFLDSSSNSQRGTYPCRFQNECAKSFVRSADLERHYRHIHAEGSERGDLSFSCDYKRSVRPKGYFIRKEHYRNHCKDFYKEEVGIQRFVYSNPHRYSLLLNGNQQEASHNPTSIWQVARATTAAWIYLDPVHLDPGEFLDGAFDCNTPIKPGIFERKQVPDKGIGCLILNEASTATAQELTPTMIHRGNGHTTTDQRLDTNGI
ncbi:hypothetical protein NHQ30_011527 [Ciborinia camelliae]|nr:hypothetical protein NHQ30_011527 [Ciborinia camelliae]